MFFSVFIFIILFFSLLDFLVGRLVFRSGASCFFYIFVVCARRFLCSSFSSHFFVINTEVFRVS